MTYVDGFVLPVPKKNMKKYLLMAREGAEIWKKHGALEYFECAGDDLKPNPKWGVMSFPEMAKIKSNETVVFSFIVYKSKAHRDKVNAKVMKEMEKRGAPKDMPFEMKRMAYGGFKTIVEERNRN